MRQLLQRWFSWPVAVLALVLALGLNEEALGQTVTARIDANQTVYLPGDTLRLAVDVTNSGSPINVDIYVFFRLPGSDQVVSVVKNVPLFGRWQLPRALWPYARGRRVSGTSPIQADPLVQYVWQGNEPAGTYQVNLLLVRTGPPLDSNGPSHDLIASARDSFDVKRPLVEHVETATRSEATIEAEGGEVSAVSSQGTIYRLTVPRGALTDPTSIAITPVTSISNLPLSGSLGAAVKLEPSGLQFREPATLAIDVPGGVSEQGLLGFLYNGTGENFAVLPADVSGNTVSLQVSHFSTAGVASGTPADFVAQVGPLVAALPSTLPISQTEELVRILITWVDRFGVGLCDGTDQTTQPLCTAVYQKGVDSLTANVTAVCAQASSALLANEPFEALNIVHGTTALLADLAALHDVASILNLPPIDPTLSQLACLPATLSSIIPLAEAEGQSKLLRVIPSGDPSAPYVTLMDAALLLLQNISSDAALIGRVDITTAAQAATGRLMTTLINDAEPLCSVDPLVADTLLFRPLRLFDANFLNSLTPLLGNRFEVAAAGCRLTITPPGVTLGPSQQQQFGATFVTPAGAPPPQFVWRLDPNCGGTVSEFGLYVAGPVEGTCELTVSIPLSGPVATQRPFFKTVNVITTSVVVVMSRSVVASKALRAGSTSSNFVAGPYTDSPGAVVFSQTVNSKESDPDSGTATVNESRIGLVANPALLNRVITGTGNLGATTVGDAQASVLLGSQLTAELQGAFDCQLQVTTSPSGLASAFLVRLSHGGGTVFNLGSTSSATAVCGPGVYTLDVSSSIVLGQGTLKGATRTFSYTLTLTPRPNP